MATREDAPLLVAEENDGEFKQRRPYTRVVAYGLGVALGCLLVAGVAYGNGGVAQTQQAKLGSFDLAFVKSKVHTTKAGATTGAAGGDLGQPTGLPTGVPTGVPTGMPTAMPTPSAVAVPTPTPAPGEPTAMPTPAPAAEQVPTAAPTATPAAKATPMIPAVPHSPEETALFNAEEALRAAANRKAAYEAAWHLARKAAEAAAAETANKHAEYERLNSALKEAEKEARQATDDLRDSTSVTESSAEKAEAALMEAATIKAEKKALAAHAKLDDDNSVARIAQHTKQLNFLKSEEQRLRELSIKADQYHEEKEAAAREASLNAINAKTAAKKAKEVGMESTQAGQARAAKIALLTARSKQAEANLLQAAYMQSEAAAKLAAGQRMVAEQQETLNDELALEKLLAAKSRKSEQDFIDATSKHAARETQTAAEGRKAEIDLFTAAVKDADHTATYETAKRVVDRAQEIAELKYKAEVKANDKARDLQEKYDIAKAAYEQAKAAVAIAEKKFTQAEDHLFEATKPTGEPDDEVNMENPVAQTQQVFEDDTRRTSQNQHIANGIDVIQAGAAGAKAAAKTAAKTN